MSYAFASGEVDLQWLYFNHENLNAVREGVSCVVSLDVT